MMLASSLVFAVYSSAKKKKKSSEWSASAQVMHFKKQ